jgi:hypothetical protein
MQTRPRRVPTERNEDVIHVLEELDRALCAARAAQNPAPDEFGDGDRRSYEDGGQGEPTESLSEMHRRVGAALSYENATRASFVTRAELALYLSVDDNEPQTRLVDLLCHLRHWAEANEVDFKAASGAAEWHYTEEKREASALEAPFASASLGESDDRSAGGGGSDRDPLGKFERLRAEVEAGRLGLPRWRCPHCYSDELMIHRPVWETGPIDQGVEADEPFFEWTDWFAEVTEVAVEFDCCSCERRLTQILRRETTDPVTYELWPSDEERS